MCEYNNIFIINTILLQFNHKLQIKRLIQILIIKNNTIAFQNTIRKYDPISVNKISYISVKTLSK